MSDTLTIPLRKPASHYGSTNSVTVADGEPGDAPPEELETIVRDHKTRLGDVRSWNEFVEWATTDSCSKCGVLYFFIGLLFPFVLGFYYFVLGDTDSTYIIIAVFGTLNALYGLNHFRLLFMLKAEVDDFEHTNTQLTRQRQGLQNSLENFSRGVNHLKDEEKKLSGKIKKMAGMIRKLEALEDALSVSQVESVAGLTQLSGKAKKTREKCQAIAEQQERTILYRCFQRIERAGEDTQGIVTRDEYKQFIDLLPKQFKPRFERMGNFDDLVKMCRSDSSEYIDSKSFQEALNMFAKMQVNDVDIVFEVEHVDPLEMTEESTRQIKVIKQKTRRSHSHRKHGP